MALLPLRAAGGRGGPPPRHPQPGMQSLAPQIRAVAARMAGSACLHPERYYLPNTLPGPSRRDTSRLNWQVWSVQQWQVRNRDRG
jgi:hypothetical protein